MIKLYGITTSRTFRPMWLLEEINQPYELISIDFRKAENLTEDYLTINPNGKIPTMIDGHFVLYESMAINLYLAKKYGGDIYPDSAELEALTNMWSFWVTTEVEYSLLSILMNTRILPKDQRDPGKVERNTLSLVKPFTVLNDALHGRDYLITNTFTIADLNVSAVISWCKPAKLSLDKWPDLQNWLSRCTSRPAFKQTIRK